MKNILSPEEAKKPVTYGDLAIILGETVKSLSQESIKYSEKNNKYIIVGVGLAILFYIISTFIH